MGLMNEIRDLSLEEKIELSEELQELITEEKLNNEKCRKEIAERLINTLCEIMCIEFHPESRERRQHIARCILSETLVKMGYTETETGYFLKKDHTTIHRNKYIPKEWCSMPNMYREEIEIYNKFKSRI